MNTTPRAPVATSGAEGLTERRFRGEVARRYDRVWVVLAPPRTCSTLLSRALWNLSRIAFYAHEPFDLVYHGGLGLDRVLKKLACPLDVSVSSAVDPDARRNILIKELSFQVGQFFPLLASLTGDSIAVLVRDPRRSIASRMHKRAAVGLDPIFPPVESGWTTLVEQVDLCRKEGIPYVVLDAADLVRDPPRFVGRVCEAFRLPFGPELLSWSPAGGVDFGLFRPEQRHWNDRVLASTGFDPVSEPPLSVDDFPTEGGMRAHVGEALGIYRSLLHDPNRIT